MKRIDGWRQCSATVPHRRHYWTWGPSTNTGAVYTYRCVGKFSRRRKLANMIMLNAGAWLTLGGVIYALLYWAGAAR